MIHYAAVSLQGKHRKHNNDRLVIGHDILPNLLVRSASASGSIELPCFAAVCDGVGKNGGVAAELVAGSLSSLSFSRTEGNSDVFAELFRINSDLANFSEMSPCNSSATTISGILIEPGQFTAYHLGDSRIYKLDPDGFSLLTRDHTVNGQLSKYLGIGTLHFRPLIHMGDYSPGSLFFLCTDGLYKNMYDFQIASILFDKEVSLETRCDRLLSVAAEKSEDDMSVIILDTSP